MGRRGLAADRLKRKFSLWSRVEVTRSVARSNWHRRGRSSTRFQRGEPSVTRRSTAGESIGQARSRARFDGLVDVVDALANSAPGLNVAAACPYS